MSARRKNLFGVSRGMLLGVLLVMQCTAACSYEIDTHARITREAVLKSVLNSTVKKQSLGLLKSRKITAGGIGEPTLIGLGLNYYDQSSSDPVQRSATMFDQVNTSVMKQYGLPAPLERWGFTVFDNQPIPYFPADWLARGTVREDDSKELPALWNRWVDGERNAEQQLDASPQRNRFCNHFYDPVNNRALTPGFSATALICPESEVLGSAPQWSLGNSATDATGTAVSAPRQNGFTILDAREAMWRALTGTVGSNTVVAYNRTERDAWWATTFRALGSVVHNLQDMAQPQHTRNEPHGPGGPTLFEHYVNQRALGVLESQGTGQNGLIPPVDSARPGLQYGDYVPPTFARYRDYFSTHSGIASYSGLGMANYSNRGFFTMVAGFGNTEYEKPRSVLADYQVVTTGTVHVETYLRGAVADLLRSTSTEILMTREGVFTDALHSVEAQSPAAAQYLYSIDRAVIDDQVSLLIPRAVGYSAGLINFFFRGRLDIQPTSDGIFGVLDHGTDSAFKKLVVKVKNTTATIQDPVTSDSVLQAMSSGKFVAVVRYHRDWKYKNDLSEAIGLGACNSLAAVYGAGNEPGQPGHDPTVGTACRDGNETMVVSAPLVQSLDADETKEMTFDFSGSPIPLSGVDYALQIVYRGALGDEEDAIATGYRDMADPMFVARHNLYDYILSDFPSGNVCNDLGCRTETSVDAAEWYGATSPLYENATNPSYGDFGLQCWSLLGVQPFQCYGHSVGTSYQYTFGPRSSAPVATATAVTPGYYTRIAVLAPLSTIDSPQGLPWLRVERARLAGGPFMGESVYLPFRHSTHGDLKWPEAMRGVNSWQSDGYTWALSHVTSPLSDRWVSEQYCGVMPMQTLMSQGVYSLPWTRGIAPATPAESYTLFGDGRVEVNAPSFSVPLDMSFSCAALRLDNPGLAQPLTATSSRWFTGAIRGEAYKYSSSYSSWDMYVGNRIYGVLESPVSGEFLSVDWQKKYVEHAKLRNPGVGSGTAISNLPPTPVSIAAKYR